MSTDIILSSSPPTLPPTCPYKRQPLTFTPFALFLPIFAVLFFLLAFFLVHFFRDDLRDFLRRCFSRRRAPPPPSRRKAKPGLDRIVLDSFPVFLHGKVEEGKAGLDCPVCLSEFEEGDEVRLLTVCCHAFHAGCVDRWLLERDTCPVCRSELTAVLPANEEVLGGDSHVVTIRQRDDTVESLLRWIEEMPLQRIEDGRMHG